MCKSLAAVVTLIYLSTLGCSAGRPGAYHHPPKVGYFHEPIVLEWKQSIRGSIGAGAAARYSAQSVFYRVGGSAPFKQAAITKTEARSEYVVFQAIIPPISPDEGDVLEYYETGKFDGHTFQSFFLNEEGRAIEANDVNPRRLPLVTRHN